MRRRFLLLGTVLTVVTATVLVTQAPAGASPGPIAIAGFTYHPAVNVARPGQMVTVVNVDGTAIGIPHSLTADNGAFNTGIFKAGARRFRAPTRPGPYRFHCQVHFFMHGLLVVTPR